MRLTRLGKIVIASVALIMTLMVWLLFLRPHDTGPDLTVPADTGGYSFPFKSATERDRFADSSREVVGYCPFFDQYSAIRGLPITFQALIAPSAKQSPYYYRDDDLGMEFIPAYFVAPGTRGVLDARAFSHQDFTNLPPCAQTTGGVILLGFKTGDLPPSQLINLEGMVWWSSGAMNPAQFDTQAGAETGDAPVVVVGSYETLSPSQVSAPASSTRALNTAIARGPGIIRIGRIEYADDQTRVWVELINKGVAPLQQWAGLSQATLKEDGGPSLPQGAISRSSDDGDSEDATAPLDGLPNEAVPPQQSGTLKGYLFFPRVDASKVLYLSMPDLTGSDRYGKAQPIVIRIPPAPAREG